MHPNAAAALAVIKQTPLKVAMFAFLETLRLVAMQVHGMKDAARPDSEFWKELDDLERGIMALLHNQIQPILERAKSHPDATVGDA